MWASGGGGREATSGCVDGKALQPGIPSPQLPARHSPLGCAGQPSGRLVSCEREGRISRKPGQEREGGRVATLGSQSPTSPLSRRAGTLRWRSWGLFTGVLLQQLALLLCPPGASTAAALSGRERKQYRGGWGGRERWGAERRRWSLVPSASRALSFGFGRARRCPGLVALGGRAASGAAGGRAPECLLKCCALFFSLRVLARLPARQGTVNRAWLLFT